MSYKQKVSNSPETKKSRMMFIRLSDCRQNGLRILSFSVHFFDFFAISSHDRPLLLFFFRPFLVFSRANWPSSSGSWQRILHRLHGQFFNSPKGCPPHSMLFLCIGKDSFDCLFAPCIDDFILFCMTKVVSFLHVFLPYMALNHLQLIFALSATG